MQNIYTSTKGEFLTFATWVLTTKSPAELEIHDNNPDSEEWKNLYKMWVTAEQINSHKTIDDNGVETVLTPPQGV